MGRLKVMVVGHSGVGKTSLIKGIVRSCEDIVHVDPVAQTTPNQSIQTSIGTNHEPTEDFVEIQASTRPYPLWWSDMESSRGLWRRKSFGEGILERNICFIDTPGTSSEKSRERVLQEIQSLLLENAQTDNMSDNQLLNLFSGEEEPSSTLSSTSLSLAANRSPSPSMRSFGSWQLGPILSR